MNNNFFKNFLGKTGFNSQSSNFNTKPINSFDDEDDDELSFENQKQEPKNVLFSNTIEQEKLNKKRNDLINELSSNLTPAQILYSTVDELENLKENNKSKQDIDNLTFKTKDDNKKIYKNENQYFIKDKKDEEDKEELTPAEILYGKRKNKEKDEEKPTGGASSIESENKIKGAIAGPAISINKNTMSNNTVDYGFNRPAIDIRYYNELSKEYDKEVGNFLRNNTDDSKKYSNDIRHQFVSAVFARNLGSKASKILGDLNELKPIDLLDPVDSKIDKINNEIGRWYAKQYPNMPREKLLKLMLKDYPKNRQTIIQKMNEKSEKQKKLEKEYL